MLVQSHTKSIDILPALPAALPSGEVKGICARGGFVLNIKWKDGKLEQLTVVSKAGNDLPLRYLDKTITVKTAKNTSYTFDASLNKL